MPDFIVKKDHRIEEGPMEGVFYIKGDLVTLTFQDLAIMPDDLLEDFDGMFTPENEAAKAMADVYPARILERRKEN